jgi:hypothetical protein
MATYSFNLSSQAAAADVKQRVLIIAIEEGAAAWQVNALTNFIRMARNVWPHLKILPIAVP